MVSTRSMDDMMKESILKIVRGEFNKINNGEGTTASSSRNGEQTGRDHGGWCAVVVGLLHEKFYNSLGSAPNHCSVVWARLGVVYHSLEE
ncbi:hypothetical protein Tco_1184710 [Tanacetum coccineum]